MDKKLKLKALKNLAKSAGDVAKTAILKETSKIIEALQKETQYDRIENQLEYLDAIAYRVHEETVVAIRNLLERLKGIELTYQESLGYPVERLKKYQNSYVLMVRALEVLEHIRYHQPDKILDIFFEYSCHEDESVAKQAKHGIEEIAGYDLDIFYGDGKDWSGLGWEPQEKVLEKIISFDETQKQKYFSAIIVACEQILSPTISGESSTYKTFTWQTGVIPATDGIKIIRKKALVELQHIYTLAINIEEKRAVLNAIETATDTPHMGDYGDDVLAMIVENSIAVVEFLKTIAVSDDLQLMQKIEHDTYWVLYHKGELDKAIHKTALEIRDALYADEEYQKFRILIGFESVFHDWEKGGKERDDFDHERKYREAEALKLAKSIDKDSYVEWKNRIIHYASIKSNDMATFPYFGKFLEYFGESSPDLALNLLSEIPDQLGNFIIAILSGISKKQKKEVYSLIESWCNEGKYLFSLARFFEFTSEVNEGLLKKILDKALEYDDIDTLNQIISSVSAQYSKDKKTLVRKFIMPALEKLTTHKNSSWIFGFWYRKQRGNILDDLEVFEYETILNNLFWLKEIDYHAEEILCVIAEKSPKLVVEFFCKRLSKEKDEEDETSYNAIPYSFHKLSEPLSKHPEQLVDTILDIYDGNYGLFIYHGALLLKIIFPNFPIDFQQKLLRVIESKEKNNLLFVMAILRNYDGNPIIHNVCKELVKILPDDSDLENEIKVILQSTGVVSGEYGFVNAYNLKFEEIQPWLQDENPKVKEFTQKYIADLEKLIEYEKKRTDEDITLRKYQYGSDEE